MSEKTKIDFKVGVLCSTYNHSKYIKDTCDGLTMQKTDFPYICCIKDDASIDGEQDILENYLNEHFQTTDASSAYYSETDYAHIHFARHKTNLNCYFVLILLKENHFMAGKDNLPYTKEWLDDVEYLAFCEGDDYWTDTRKLQLQADCMDKDNNCSLCCHNATMQYPDGHFKRMRYPFFDEKVSLASIFTDWDYATASFMLRNKYWNDDLFWFWSGAPVADAPMVIYAAINGNVRYLGKQMAVYRYQIPHSWTEQVKNDPQFAKEVNNSMSNWLHKTSENVPENYKRYFLFSSKIISERMNKDRTKPMFIIRYRLMKALHYRLSEIIDVFRCVLRSTIDNIKK